MKNMVAFKELKDALAEARTAVRVAKSSLDSPAGDTLNIPKTAYSLLPEVEKAFEDIKKSVEQDISRYLPGQKTTGDERYNFAALTSPKDNIATGKDTKFSSFLINKLQKALHRPLESADIINQEQFEKLAPAERYLYMLIAKEIDCIESISLNQKMKKVLNSVGNKRIEEAIILTKNSRKDDPRNHSVSFVLSQLLYYKSSNGHTECLPEARDEAKKACAYSEKVDEQRLLRYRYHSIATERNFSPEKCVEIMRAYYMTNPESLSGRDGIAANSFYNLRCWIILSTVPTSLWSTFEIESLAEIVIKAIGGSLIYIYYLRRAVLIELDAGNDLFTNHFQDLERLLGIFYVNYQHMKSAIDSDFDDQFIIKGSGPYPWITAHRYMKKFLAVAPLPSSDEILMHMSLDGHACEKNAYPEGNMLKIGLIHSDYWRSWASVLSPVTAINQGATIPYQRLTAVKGLFAIYTKLLSLLEKLEQEVLTEENWAEIESLMPLYAYENLLEIGHGNPSTQLLRTKEDAPFLAYYREWRKETRPSALPSEMIKQQAKNGAFINFKEVHAFFEGVVKVFASTQYNLKKHTQNARAAYDAKYNAKSGIDFSKHLKGTWWLYFGVLPLLGIGVLALASSGDPIAAMKTMAAILGGIILFAAVVVLVWPQKK